VVLDTSALLAVFFNETAGPWVAAHMEAHADVLLMSTVNYTELLILMQDRQPLPVAQIRDAMEQSSIRLIPPTSHQAELAAAARIRYPLNLGDCFAYALAKDEGCPVLTLDRDFRSTDVQVVLPRAK
jgi:ribonuclease VapC